MFQSGQGTKRAGFGLHSDDQQSVRHWAEVATKRARSVHFGLADVIEVPSWKDETKEMHYGTNEIRDQPFNMDGALDVEGVAVACRVAFRAASILGFMFACAALDLVPM
eukprot:TRINITY_DN90242_c0_g1_i1.p1 TRINITY_DN90242_c0_g1~~TRINITY_DN90242_c0_g1_i1.p1  ORF type:complete len:109 (+),score=15.82 TRINITY_DN90242_c0_g1_i1:52-378(+)